MLQSRAFGGSIVACVSSFATCLSPIQGEENEPRPAGLEFFQEPNVHNRIPAHPSSKVPPMAKSLKNLFSDFAGSQPLPSLLGLESSEACIPPPPPQKITYAKKFQRNYFPGDCDNFAYLITQKNSLRIIFS